MAKCGGRTPSSQQFLCTTTLTVVQVCRNPINNNCRGAPGPRLLAWLKLVNATQFVSSLQMLKKKQRRREEAAGCAGKKEGRLPVSLEREPRYSRGTRSPEGGGRGCLKHSYIKANSLPCCLPLIFFLILLSPPTQLSFLVFTPPPNAERDGQIWLPES